MQYYYSNLYPRLALKKKGISKGRYTQGLINYIDNKAKWRHLKKLTSKGILLQVFIFLRPRILYPLLSTVGFIFYFRRETVL